MTQQHRFITLASLVLGACSGAQPSDPDAAPRFVDAREPDAMTSAADAAPAIEPRLSEILKNPPGPDDTHEFFEVQGTPGQSLAGYHIVVLDGDLASDTAGEVDNIIALGGLDDNGFYATEFFGDEVENGAITVLLVEGLAGQIAVGDDLDSDDDGALDLSPWDRLVDAVALVDDPEDLAYSDVVLDNDFDGQDEEAVGASVFFSGSEVFWVRANREGSGLEGIPGAGGVLCKDCNAEAAQPGRARLTPGAANQLVD